MDSNLSDLLVCNFSGNFGSCSVPYLICVFDLNLILKCKQILRTVPGNIFLGSITTYRFTIKVS